MIKYVKGNLLGMLDMFDVVLQGNNCFHTHGAGIARAFADRFPQVPEADRMQTVYGDKRKLGTYSKARVGNTDVLNCYTQYDFDARKKPFDYKAFERCLRNVKAEYGGKRIGMPMIGAGLAGGDWVTIASIIENQLRGEDVTVVQL